MYCCTESHSHSFPASAIREYGSTLYMGIVMVVYNNIILYVPAATSKRLLVLYIYTCPEADQCNAN